LRGQIRRPGGQRLLQQDGRPQRAHRRPVRLERRRPRMRSPGARPAMTWSPIRPLTARAGWPRPLSLYLCSGVLALLASAGCSSEEEPPGPGSGGSAAGGASGSGAAAASSGGSAGAPSSSGGSAGGGATGGSSGAPSSGGSGGSGGSAGGGQAGAGFTEVGVCGQRGRSMVGRSEEHTSELQSRENLVCR